MEFGPGVLAVVREAPDPTLTINGPTATITGVRFLHGNQCGWCRHGYTVATDGGVITIGIDTPGKQPRWYEKRKPGTRPTVPAECPNCGHALLPNNHWREPCETVQSSVLFNEVWTTIRAQHPDLAAAADRNR
jgi:hypothetical protein